MLTRVKELLGLAPAAVTDGNMALWDGTGGNRLRDAGRAPLPAFMPLSGLVAPSSAGWAWVNQGGASVADVLGGIYMEAPAAAGNSVRLRKKAAPGTPYTITAAFLPGILLSEQYHNFGLAWRQSSDGKLLTNQVQFTTAGGGLVVRSTKLQSATLVGTGATYVTRIIAPWGPVIYLRITDDGANRICSFSFDGVHFLAYHTVGRTDYLTPDEVGWFVESNNATSGLGVTLLSWVQS